MRWSMSVMLTVLAIAAPLTADPHVSTGSTPGVGVLKVTESGRNAVFESVAAVSNVDGTGVERADVHALVIRVK